MTSAIEDSAWVDDHARRMHLAGDHSLGFNLHAALRKDHAVEPPGDDHPVSFDLPFYFGAFAEDHCLFRDNITFNVTIDAKRPGHRQSALQRDALVDKAGPLFVVSFFRSAARPLPCHEIPQRQISPL